MRRLPLPAAAIAIAALLAVAPAAVAPAASPARTIVTVELELQASQGLHAQLATSDDEVVTLELERESSMVTYEKQGEVTEAGLKVRFGQLGLIDVAFTPTKTLSSTEPSPGCEGAPRTVREGIFTGTIDFTGEREYVRLEGPQAEGSMSVISKWRCPEEPTPFAAASRHLAPSSRDKNEAATLYAGSRGCSCFFAAAIHRRRKGGKSLFYGVKAERREGMEIARVTYARAGASAFAFDHAAGTATVRPPRPFRGHATFRRRPHGRDLWRSTLRVPILGAAPLRLYGPGSGAALYPEDHFD
jgi:hypothetical protein